MSKLKMSQFSCILMLFFTLQLGACAKEVPSVATQEINNERPSSPAQDSKEQVLKLESQIKENVVAEPAPTIKNAELKLDIVEPGIKETVAEEAREKIVVALAEPTKEEAQVVTQVQPEIKSQASTEVKEVTAAQAMLDLDQYKGKVVYLDFWASWCQPCQQTFPWMDAMQKKYPDDIVFVAVNFGESPDDTVEFLKRFPADIKFVYDPLLQISREYGVPGLPYSFIYGRNGELLGKHAGFSGGSEINLEAALKNLFASGE